ncbi:DUF3824 domain-containing protein [Streptomyces sp. SPB074]|uniref:DUF3824 domain-containing protein n=1 Tax=Streptomyces sp. (strain SPB074) TaxID=465543 RepID=UPI0001D1DE8B|nr:integral membrane protein [Streptomyces sp. SPB074]
MRCAWATSLVNTWTPHVPATKDGHPTRGLCRGTTTRSFLRARRAPSPNGPPRRNPKSYGDPNNPYGAPGGKQPGDPQGNPPAYPQQPGYGYPQAPPVDPNAPYGYGPGPGPGEMPGGVKTARVLLWVIVGLCLLGTVIYSLGAVASDGDDFSNFESSLSDSQNSGIAWGIAVFSIVWAAGAAALALQVRSGGNGVRITTLVFGIVTAVLGLFPFVIVGIPHLVMGVLVAVFVGKSDGVAWYNRPRG